MEKAQDKAKGLRTSGCNKLSEGKYMENINGE
jgi:hypothetical protein